MGRDGGKTRGVRANKHVSKRARAERMSRIFISAVSRELKSYRAGVARVLRRKEFEVRDQEHFRQGPATLLEQLAAYIEKCDAVIFLVGTQAGAFPSEDHASALGVIPTYKRYRKKTGQIHASYTQWEFLLAKHYGKDTYVFLTDDDFTPDNRSSETRDSKANQAAYRQWMDDQGEHYDLLTTRAKLIEDVLVLPFLESDRGIGGQAAKKLALKRAHERKRREQERAREAADQALADYRTARIEEWSDDRYGTGDKLFTRLSLLLDLGRQTDERWIRQPEKYDSLSEILQAHPNYPALVLLGDPGAGKSTLLRRLDLDSARANRDAETKGTFSYFVSLRDYRASLGELPSDPMNWLRGKWADDWKARFPHLPELDDLLRGESLLLLDALNEMPLRTAGDYRLLVDGWAAVVANMRTRFPKCRIVFSCRSLDYSASLSSSDIQVPHVEIERLDKAAIGEFLKHYASESASSLLEAIEASGQLELYSTAYLLKMLCDRAGRTGKIPQDRSALFTAFVRESLRWEIDGRNRLLVTPGLLDEADLARLARLLGMANPPWHSPYELPERGPLFPQLGRLAHVMQGDSSTAGNSQVVVSYDKALDMLTSALGRAQAEQLIDAACYLRILVHDRPREKVQFIHQLMQEYFAARHLAGAPEPNRVRSLWRKAEVSPSLEETLANLNINEPLPMLESTGWEETTLLAVAMAKDRGGFIEGMINSNLPLAARAAAQILASEVQHDAPPGRAAAPRLPPELVARAQRLLLERMVDPEADLRARIAAGKALGELGDPRFKGKRDASGKFEYLTPPAILVPGGTHQIGGDEGIHKHEGPRHTVELADFHIAQFPVTNTEWACFMQAGGYDDDRWWGTNAAKKWRSGETTRVARDQQWRDFRQMLKSNPDYLSRKLREREISPKAAEDHEKAMKTSDEVFESILKKEFDESLRKGEAHNRYTEPRRWRNKDFNNPLQPVVGICWFEAQAYCVWLSSQTGQHWRLPTEAEWETAARFGGSDDARYPWGSDFKSAYCNTFEGHIRAPTPVGMFLGGNTTAGLADISGNACEWTSSRYSKERYPYPYSKEDGREIPDDMEDDPKKYYRRVLRGGSWYYSKDEARIAFRLRFHPGYHSQSTGLRLGLGA